MLATERKPKNTIELTHNGETLSMTAWARRAGIPYSLLHKRIMNLGWDMERALTAPPTINVSKDVAERELNDMAISALPQTIKDIVIKGNYYGTKPGRYVRDQHRPLFDKWFEEEFKPNYKPEGA